MAHKKDKFESKVVLVGQPSVGKTCIVKNYISSVFDASSQPTLGVSFNSKSLSFGHYTVELQIWDTAGEEQFRSLAPMYYRGAQVAIIVYAIDDIKSFQEVDFWVNSLKESADNNIQIFLVGNKCDLENQRVVELEEGQEKADEINALFFETSASTGQNISDLFFAVGKSSFELLLHSPVRNSIFSETSPKEKKSKCCK